MKRFLQILFFILFFQLIGGNTVFAFNPLFVFSGGSASTPCEDAGCPASYLFCSTADYDSDTDKACYDSGSSTQDGSVYGGGLTIDTWSNFGISGPTSGGIYGYKGDADNEALYWPIGNLSTSEGTYCLQVLIVSTVGTNHIFTISDGDGDTVNYISAYTVNATDNLRLLHVGDGPTVVEVYSPESSVTADGWMDFCFAWTVTSDQIAVSVNGGSSWTNDSDEDTVTVMNAGDLPTYIGIADYDLPGQGMDQTVYFGNAHASNTYKDTIPW